MPYVKRGREQTDNDAPAKKRKTEYDILDNIGYKEDHYHALFRELPNLIDSTILLIGQYVVSFLNSSGGILAFGVRATGVIYGEKISRREEDSLKCAIDEAIKRINPCVCYNKYRVNFTPVKGRLYDDTGNCPRQVLEIKVTPGEPYELYEDTKHEAFTRNGSKLMGPLTPHQIKDITITKLKQRIRAEKKLADFLSPARPSVHAKKLPSAAAAKMSDKGEGHKTVAARAVASKAKSAKDKSSSGTSSLATVARGSEEHGSSGTASLAAEAKGSKEKGGKDRSTADSKTTTKASRYEDSSGSQTSTSTTKKDNKDSIQHRSSKNSSDSDIEAKDCDKSDNSDKIQLQSSKSSGKETKETDKSDRNNTLPAPTKEMKDSSDHQSARKLSGENKVEGEGQDKSASVKKTKASDSNKKDTGSKTSAEKAKGMEAGKSTSSSSRSSKENKKTPLKEDKENKKSSKPLLHMPCTETRKVLSTNNFRSSSNTWRKAQVPVSKTSSYGGRQNTSLGFPNCIRKRVIQLPPPPPPPRHFSRPAYSTQPPLPTTVRSLSNYRVPDYYPIRNVPVQGGIYWDPYYRCYRQSRR